MPFTGSKMAKYGSADMPLYIPEQLGRIYDERKVSNSKAKLSPILAKCKNVIMHIRETLPEKKPHTERYYKRIAFLNKYSLVFHFLLACMLIFVVELISRRDFISTVTFLSNTRWHFYIMP